MSDTLVFIHLSDIHFTTHGNGDPDAELRNELELDVQQMTRDYARVNGILVTGDIAYAGNMAEYDKASRWLDQLTSQVRAPEGRIWAVPGNHDVDRKVIEENSFIGLLHDKIRPSLQNDEPQMIANQVDESLNHWLTKTEGDILFETIENFNRFAMRVDCHSSRERLAWQDDISLNDGSILRLWGINSAILSGPSDNVQAKRLVVGTRQSLPPTRAGVTYLTLCHHPPLWLCEQDNAKENLCSRAAIQLFGHRHRQRVNQESHSLIVSAGAVHPARDEPNWQPRYNILEIKVICDPTRGRLLQVKVWSRVYRENRCFEPDVDRNGALHRIFELPLPAWATSTEAVGTPSVNITLPAVSSEQQPTVVDELAHVASAVTHTTGTAQLIEASINMNTERQAERKLVYRFFGLGYADIMTIAAELGLFSNEDEGVKDTERFQRYYHRAKEKGLMDRLRELVEARYSNRGQSIPSHTTIVRG